MGFFDIFTGIGKSFSQSLENQQAKAYEDLWRKLSGFDRERLESFIKAKGSSSHLTYIAILKLYSIWENNGYYKSEFISFLDQIPNTSANSIIQRIQHICKSDIIQLGRSSVMNEIRKVGNKFLEDKF